MRDPLIFLPGMMCDARVFGPQIAELSSEFAVMVAPITIGERIEEIASKLLDQLPRRFALVGLGMGGAVAMEIVRRAPDRVRRIALISSTPFPDTPDRAAGREALIVQSRAGRLDDVIQQQLNNGDLLAPGPARAEVQALLMDMAQCLGPKVYVAQSRALQRRTDQHVALRRCKVPALVISGAHDGVVPPARQQVMAELMHDGEFVVLDQAGHFPPLEAPGAVTDALRRWLSIRPAEQAALPISITA